MKKQIIFIIWLLFVTPVIKAQVLYTDNFDNYNLGNLGTDVTGKIPGQWGWYTVSKDTQSNSFFTIVNETGRGKVFEMSTGLTDEESIATWKTNLHTFMANRAAGNDVIMFEIDYYTGPMQTNGGGYAHIILYSIGDPTSLTNPPEYLLNGTFNKTIGFSDIDPNQNPHFNTWVKFIFYLDYPNKKVYHHIPSLNRVSANDFLEYITSANLIQEYPISSIVLDVIVSKSATGPQIYTRNRYDNIKITAISAVPPNVIALSTTEQLAAKFNLYPNPASSVVNITNSENMQIQQITVYDVAGKQLNTQIYNSETDIQLNVEHLASGTYMLHLQTKQGTAVKKLVKK